MCAEELGGRQALEDRLAEMAKERNGKPASKRPKGRGRGLSKADAEKMAGNLEAYDGKIVAGRLKGGSA